MQKSSFNGEVQSISEMAYCNMNWSMRLNLINRYKGIRYKSLTTIAIQRSTPELSTSIAGITSPYIEFLLNFSADFTRDQQ